MPVCRHLALIFGDQLTLDHAALAALDREQDAVLMMEVREEASYVPQHGIRLTLFFAAMRHHAEALRADGWALHYSELTAPENGGSFAAELTRRIEQLEPEEIHVAQPGDYRVLEALERACRAADRELVVHPDTHFMCSTEDFHEFAADRKGLLLEYFYRWMRKRTGILMTDGKPVGGAWNFDKENRQSFGKDGPLLIPAMRTFAPDAMTQAVMAMVRAEFPDSPGELDGFDYPVSRADALAALDDFIANRLPDFGTYQDAMTVGEPYLYHSRLSCVMNLHLLDPREIVAAALAAYHDGAAPLNAVEGFVRQIIGWREFVRGVYWLHMPDYAGMNHLGADLPAPAVLWTGETDMRCLQESVGQLRRTAYAHHIQRLMVLGLFGMLLGVRPYEMHRWHMSMYADAVDWVSLPNVLGMSQFGDGGIVGTKPYAASGNYIAKMSDYCQNCPFDPKKATGDDACPMTTLYWDFLARNREQIASLRHMGYQLANLDRKSAVEREAIRARAAEIRRQHAATGYLPDAD